MSSRIHLALILLLVAVIPAGAASINSTADCNGAGLTTGCFAINTPGSADNLKQFSDKYNAHYHQYSGMTLTNRTGGSLVAGDVVTISGANNSSVIVNDVAVSLRPYVVATATIANVTAGEFARAGVVTVKAAGTINRSEYIRKSATSKSVETTGVANTSDIVPPPEGAIGYALAPSSGGFVTALMYGVAPTRATAVAVHAVAGSGTQSCGTPIGFASELFDTNTMHDNATNNSRLTVNTAGVYMISGVAGVSSNGIPSNGVSEGKGVKVRLNGTTQIYLIPAASTSTSTTTGAPTQFFTTYQFAVNDYIELLVDASGTGVPGFTCAATGSAHLAMTLTR